MARLPTLIAYDISDDPARGRALRTVLEWRLDGQKSVHECLLSMSEAEELFAQLSALLDSRTDRLMLARIEDRQVRSVRRHVRSRSLAPTWMKLA